MELNDLGEFGLIEHLAKDIKTANPQTVKGIGDDCAVLAPTEGVRQVVTTDLLLEGIHFDLTYCPLKHLGYKAVAVNLSDVYAMNATPKQITVSLGVSAKLGLEDIEELYAGIKLCCGRYGVDIVGGDTSSSLTGLTISITAIGEARPERIAYRHGAKPKNLLCVTGDLGAAYMGLQLLEREKRAFAAMGGAAQGNAAGGGAQFAPQFDGYDYILERQLKPEPRADIIKFLEDIDVVPTAMMDISDGLSSEVLHICRQSGCGALIYEEKIPIDHVTQNMAEELGISPVTAALNGGEDYELLFAIDLADYPKFQSRPGPSIYAIGHITDPGDPARLVLKSGGEVDLKAQGWKAFGK